MGSANESGRGNRTNETAFRHPQPLCSLGIILTLPTRYGHDGELDVWSGACPVRGEEARKSYDDALFLTLLFGSPPHAESEL